jgi:hypothetical protein
MDPFSQVEPHFNIQNATDLTKYLYVVIDRCYAKHLNHTVKKDRLPSSGVYLFFEKGEYVQIDGKIYDRIVRVGTHNKDGNFPGRIRQHYGNKGSSTKEDLSGNKNGSVFRKHLGGAIMRRENPNDPRLREWLKQMGQSYTDIEEKVSRTLRENFTFICFPVDTKEERLSIESGLISLLAHYPLGQPSEEWLGRFAYSPVIRSTGLWNTKETDKKPLDNRQLERIVSLMEKDK